MGIGLALIACAGAGPSGLADHIAPFTAVRPGLPATGAGRLAFDRDGVIMTANPDGSGLTALTPGYWPAWSPDGKKIAYAAAVGGVLQIFVMNADGSRTTRLTADPAVDRTPTWSPDGTKIAFSSNRTGDDELFVMNQDGSAQTLFPAAAGEDTSPSWSPDGTRVAWDGSGLAHNCEIYVARLDGSGFNDISNNAACDSQPKWSPSGTTIVFTSLRGRHPGIYTMSASGAGVTALTFNAGIDASPAWAPDGTRIVFSRNNAIMTMHPDGSHVVAVTSGAHVDADPSWQPVVAAGVPHLSSTRRPGGSLAAFESTRPAPMWSTAETSGTSSDIVPVWSPQFMGGLATFTTQQAKTDASRFDLIAGDVSTFAGSTTLMHQVHPGLILLGYENAVAVDRTQAVLWPESLYARDSAGEKIRSIAYGNYLMDPSNSAWVTTRKTACQAAVGAGFDGCILDVVGPSPSQPGYETALPYDAATGAAWTPQAWLDAMIALSRSVRSAVSPAVVFGNGVQNGAAYFAATAPTSQLVPALDGVMVEEWLRGPTTPVASYPTLAAWQQDLQMLVDIGARSSEAIVVTKVWTRATSAQRQAWDVFSLATFLLGSNGSSYYSFLQDSALATTQRTYALWSVHVGKPAGPYRSQQGYYRRDFSNGTALVNPTGQAVTVPLGGTYLDLACRPMTTASLAAHTAMILRLTCT